jgi:hypothetical protein
MLQVFVTTRWTIDKLDMDCFDLSAELLSDLMCLNSALRAAVGRLSPLISSDQAASAAAAAAAAMLSSLSC